MGSLSPARLELASGVFNLMRNLGGAIGIAACVAALESFTVADLARGPGPDLRRHLVVAVCFATATAMIPLMRKTALRPVAADSGH
jgi:hypothetical protein